MRKFVTAFLILAALGLAAPPAQAGTIQLAEMAFKSSADGLVYNTSYGDWAPPGASFSSALPGTLPDTWLGSVSFTFTGAGEHYVAGFFDYQIVDQSNNNGIFDEEADWGGALPTGWTGKSNDPWDLDPSDPPPIYDQFVAFDGANPFDNWAWVTPGHDVAVAYGYAFTLAAGVTRKVTFTVTDVLPSSYILKQVDPLSGQVLYFNGTAQDVGVGVPDSGSTLTLLGLGLAVLARLRRRT